MGALGLVLPDDAEGRAGLGAGAILLALGFLDKDGDRAAIFKLGGAAVLAYFTLRDRASSFASREEIKTDASLPAGNPGVSPQEKYNAIVGRFEQWAGGLFGIDAGTAPTVGIEHKDERAADESAGPFLGAPKNVLRVAGAWRQPLPGGTFAVAAFSSTFQAFAVVENQSNVTVAGQVRVRILHQGLLQGDMQTTLVDGPSIQLAPGELRELEMRLPAVRDADGKIELALLFNGYNLASITAQRSLVLA